MCVGRNLRCRIWNKSLLYFAFSHLSHCLSSVSVPFQSWILQHASSRERGISTGTFLEYSVNYSVLDVFLCYMCGLCKIVLTVSAYGLPSRKASRRERTRTVGIEQKLRCECRRQEKSAGGGRGRANIARTRRKAFPVKLDTRVKSRAKSGCEKLPEKKKFYKVLRVGRAGADSKPYRQQLFPARSANNILRQKLADIGRLLPALSCRYRVDISIFWR